MLRELPIPKLIATDLDGTLLRSDHSISPFTRRVLRDLEARAIHVVFVTARPPRWMKPLSDAVSGHGRAICLNGACIYEFASHHSSDIRGFNFESLTAIITDLRAALPGIAFAAERPSGAVFDPHFISDHPYGPETLHMRVEDARDDVVGKLLARMPSLPDNSFFDAVSEIVGTRGLLAYSGASGLAEITAPGVTKAAALERWALHHNIAAHEVWAFGDMPNDVPMLSWAGQGIAVANAHPEALAAATAYTLSNDEDGVAHALAYLVGLDV
ncbi:HAD family hydrolase [Timonella sp. A28]|uniref:HAD family hydrolase n=1 Tax=Timonella sp. A28 TaxID=3442640 RepID=UPI003EBD2239